MRVAAWLRATTVVAMASISRCSARQSAYLSEKLPNDCVRAGRIAVGCSRISSVIAWWLPTSSRAVSVTVWSIFSRESALLIASDAAASFWSCAARLRCHSACR
jgi:hypothetical protein